jgi:hypothetical protein
MPAKINKHVFHGVYSNFGYKPENIIKEDGSIQSKFTNYPIHFFRASFAEKENPESLDAPKEFQTEEEVLKWYKKNKYGESNFNKLEFPKDICKNYFKIPASEFYKYRGLFHRMIKGIKVTSDIEVTSEGTAASAECPECKKDVKIGFGDNAGPIVFNSPDGSPSYFEVSGGADDIGYLNGIQITVGNTAGSFSPELIPKTPLSTLSFTAVDTVGTNVGIEATVTWYKKIEYKQKIKFNINFDSTKIHDIPEVEKRLSAASNLNYQTEINLDKEQNNEKLYVYEQNIFKDEWQFDKDIFKSLFDTYPKKFNHNATFINDPVIVPKYIDYIDILNIRNEHSFFGGKDSLDNQINFTKKFTKFGNVDYTITNNNSIANINQYFDFYISGIFYIKSQKIFLCFIEIESSLQSNGSIVSKRQKCDKETICEESDNDQSSSSASSGVVEAFLNDEVLLDIITSNSRSGILQKYFMIDGPSEIESVDNSLIDLLETEEENVVIGSTNPIGLSYIFSTNDQINENPPKYKTSDCDEEEKELEFIKSKCQLKLGNNSFEIEIFKLKDTTLSFDNTNCKDLDQSYKALIKNTTTITSSKDTVFEILEWKTTDFDENNTFPNKLS